MNTPQHHLHVRKRIYKNLEAYPSPSAFRRFMDKLIYVISIIGPLMALPQVYDIYANKHAANVSFTTWFTFFLFSIVWIVYGILHKEKPIIFANTILMVLNGLVAMGVILYK